MKKVLFVRSGGGMPGLDIHTGIWLALEEAGIHPTECHGTSAGAIISALQAFGRDAQFAEALLRGLSDFDVRREMPFWKLRFMWLDYWLRSAPVRALLLRSIESDWSKLTMPLAAWATRLHDGQAVNVATPRFSPAGPTEAVLASMAISGVFEPVALDDDNLYVDGGVRRNLPLPARWRDADEIWLLIAAGRPRDYRRSRGILTALFRNIHYLMLDQILDVLDKTSDDPRVHVIWPRCKVSRGALHFDHALIRAAQEQTRAILQQRIHKGAPPQ